MCCVVYSRRPQTPKAFTLPSRLVDYLPRVIPSRLKLTITHGNVLDEPFITLSTVFSVTFYTFTVPVTE